MIKKRCLFCDQIVPTNQEGDYDRYLGCACSPGGFYSIRKDSYEPIHSFPHQKKRELFHLISAYIRELTDCGEKVTLAIDDLESIANSPKIPVTVDDKGNRLLQYMQRHVNVPGEPIIIHPLSGNYNLTYSPNQQELVYIIDMLRGEELLIREGMSFQLTEKGWTRATASLGGQKLKPCFVLVADEEIMRTEWQEMLLPKIEQLGYQPRMLSHTETDCGEKYSLELIADSKLIIADLTGQSPEVYFAAGYALGLNIPVIWTVNSLDADILHVQIKDIRPIVWNSTEELGVMLQQKFSVLE
ncbi:hypothetical protein [Fontibacillus sp. BL9]|uniref:hypothetical protein n=1 Tax=Fontibacillus sp. BL9 TaxID=3389971 RepID=UPI00397B295E